MNTVCIFTLVRVDGREGELACWYVYAQIYTHLCGKYRTVLCMRVCVCVCACVHVFLRVRENVYMCELCIIRVDAGRYRTILWVGVKLCVLACVYAKNMFAFVMYVYIYPYVCIYLYMHIRIHVCIHIRGS